MGCQVLNKGLSDAKSRTTTIEKQQSTDLEVEISRVNQWWTGEHWFRLERARWTTYNHKNIYRLAEWNYRI